MAVYFPHYEQGAPFPGTCKKCGNNQDLFGWSESEFDGSILICRRCVGDLATAINWTNPTELLDTVAKLTEENEILSAQVNRVPNLVDGLINGIRSSVTDFVFSVSYSDSAASGEDASGDQPAVEQPSEHAQQPKQNTSAPIRSARK